MMSQTRDIIKPRPIVQQRYPPQTGTPFWQQESPFKLMQTDVWETIQLLFRKSTLVFMHIIIMNDAICFI